MANRLRIHKPSAKNTWFHMLRFDILSVDEHHKSQVRAVQFVAALTF